MQQFDVFMAPRSVSRIGRPYLIVLQHERVPYTASVVVAPLGLVRPALAHARLTPDLVVLGRKVVLLTTELSMTETQRLRGPAIDNLDAHYGVIMAALDFLFSAAG